MTTQLDNPAGATVLKAAISVPAQAKVLMLDDLAAEARRVVVEARQQATRITGEARKSADLAREQAAHKGFLDGQTNGYARGYAEGMEQALTESRHKTDAELAQAAQLVRAMLGELTAGREEILRAARRQMLQFAMELAAKIVGQVTATDAGAAKANLEKALRMAGGGEVLVRANPQQVELLRKYAPELLAALGAAGQVRIESDEQIALGGVKIQARCGEIDATIQTQLANVAASLMGMATEPLLFG